MQRLYKVSKGYFDNLTDIMSCKHWEIFIKEIKEASIISKSSWKKNSGKYKQIGVIYLGCIVFPPNHFLHICLKSKTLKIKSKIVLLFGPCSKPYHSAATYNIKFTGCLSIVATFLSESSSNATTFFFFLIFRSFPWQTHTCTHLFLSWRGSVQFFDLLYQSFLYEHSYVLLNSFPSHTFIAPHAFW